MNIDIVVPFFNEDACIPSFINNLTSHLKNIDDVRFAFFFVDDGSADNTASLLDDMAKQDDRICVIHLLGNHGHQKALVAGLDHCRGDAVLMMDGDGQHPMGVAVRMIRYYLTHPGIHVVQALRQGRQQSKMKDWTSRLFYWLANRLDIGIRGGASDFRILSRTALNLISSYPDRYRNLRVLLASLPLSSAYIDYEADERLAGRSKYNARKMIRLAADGLFAFSTLPLRASFSLMAVTALLGFAYAIYAILKYLQGQVVPGWTSIIVIISFLFSAVFGVLAILSEYISRMYDLIRRHPTYMIGSVRYGNKSQGLDASGQLNRDEPPGTHKIPLQPS
jgi:glycosyltransferase involved in cell wall biosynthesis